EDARRLGGEVQGLLDTIRAQQVVRVVENCRRGLADNLQTLGIALGLAIAQVLEVTLGQFHAVGVMAQQVALDQHPADYRGDLGTCLGIEEQLFDEALKRLWCDKTHSVTSFGARGTLPRARQSLASSGNRAISKT